MKKYISILSLSAVLCSQVFAGFDEVSKDIDQYPRAAARSCQTLSLKNREYHKSDANEAYLSISRCYDDISKYLLKLANNEEFNYGFLSAATEEVQALEQYLQMDNKLVLSLTSSDFSASRTSGPRSGIPSASSAYPSAGSSFYSSYGNPVGSSLGYPAQPSSLTSDDSSRSGTFPAPGGATSSAFTYSSAPSSARPSPASAASSSLYPTPGSSFYPSYGNPVGPSLGYPAQPSSLTSADSRRSGTSRAPDGAASSAFSYSSAPSSARPSPASAAFPAPAASTFYPSYDTPGGPSLGYPAQPSSLTSADSRRSGTSRAPDGAASSAFTYSSAPSFAPPSPAYPAYAPPAPLAYPAYAPPVPVESPSLGVPKHRSSLELNIAGFSVNPLPPALGSTATFPSRPVGPVQQPRLNEEQKTPVPAAKGTQPLLKPLQVAAPPPIQWVNVPQPQKEIAFSIGATATALRQKLKLAERCDPTQADHVLDPGAFLSLLHERDRELEKLLVKSLPTKELDLSNYTKNIAALKESLSEFSRKLGPLQTKVTRLKRLIETTGCGEDISKNQEYKDLVQDLQTPLREIHGQLSQKISDLFPVDLWELRATIFPGLQRPVEARAEDKAVPQAAAVKREKISDSIDKGVREIVTKLNEDIDRQITRGAKQHGQENESIMNLGKGEVAREMFSQIDRSIEGIKRHFGLLPIPLMTVDALVQWKTELTMQFQGVEIKGLTADKIRATFKNLTDHFSDPYAHVDRRVPPTEYLKALTFFKTVLDKFKDHEDIAVLVSTVLTGLEQQGVNCGAGAFGRSILLYNATLQFLMNLEKTA